MSHAIFRTLVVTLLLLTSLCSHANTELSFYTWREQEKKLWDEINRQQLIDGVSVNTKVILYESYRPHIILELQNRKADLFQWAPGASSLKELIDRDFIKPYPGDLSAINSSALLASKGPDNQFYGVPFALQLQSLMVNKKLLNKHGIQTAPSTMQALDDIFSSLKSKGINPLHISGGANWYVSQLLGEVLMAGLVEETFAQGLVDGKECFTDKRYSEIFSTLTHWKNSGFINSNAATEDYGAMSNSIALGNSAMGFEGGWKTGSASNFFQVDPNYQFSFWALPGKSGKIYALGDGSYQVGLTSKHTKASQRVLEFTTTKKFAELFALHVGELPAYGGSISIKPGVLKTMANIVAEKTYPVSLFTAYQLNRGTPSYNTLLIEAISAVLKGDKNAEQAAEHIQAGLNSWQYIGHDQCQ